MSYHCFNRKKLLQKAKNKYQEISTEMCQKKKKIKKGNTKEKDTT